MNSSTVELKRARPALGTVMLVKLNVPANTNIAATDEVLSRAFDLCEELEQIFSKVRETSQVSRLNQASLCRDIPVSREFCELTYLALDLWKTSGGGFAPFSKREPLGQEPLILREERRQYFVQRTCDVELDLSGIAKGFIIDQVVSFLREQLPAAGGVINVGGDLRFFNSPERTADIRLDSESGKFRHLQLSHDSLANSSFDGCSVTAIADRCAVADALTKVGWFATSESVQACAVKFQAQILVFDRTGEIWQEFPNQ